MPETKKSQCAEVLEHLQLYRQTGISQRDAMWFGCQRLAARIHELRAKGYDIEKVAEKHEGGTHARYFLRAA